jgi:hypothetical protein
MAIRLTAFSGETPAVNPRLLPDNSAQIAQNVRLERGDLVPMRTSKLAHTFNADAQTIYLFHGTWLGIPSIANIVPAPVAENRLYMTLAEGPPQMLVDGATQLGLAVPRPGAPPILTTSGTLDTDLSFSIIYVTTFVTIYDEESEPSDVSASFVVSPNMTVNLGQMEVRTDRGINRRRIYRSQTGTSGSTEFYLVGEQSVAATTFSDNLAANPIQELLPSVDYNPPPDGLKGIVAMPNGIMAAFVGKKLYFSEPFIPHAWPEKYVLTTDYDIVGLGVVGQSVVVATTGHPYLASGMTPESMTMERLRVNLPCVSARGIVDLGVGVAYPSTRGLVLVSANGAQIVSQGMMTPDQWAMLSPERMIASDINGRYAASYVVRDTTYGGVILIDLTGQQPFVLRASDSFQAAFTEIGTGRLFVLTDNRKVYEWDASGAAATEYIWRSKAFVLPEATNFGVVLVEGDNTMSPEEQDENRLRAPGLNLGIEPIGAPPIWLEPAYSSLMSGGAPPPPGFMAVIYADGKAVARVTTMNRPVRLPGGFAARQWEVEVRGNQRVSLITLANTVSELAV